MPLLVRLVLGQDRFKQLLGKDDLSRLVRAATGSSFGLTRAEFGAVRKLLADQQTWSKVIGRGTVDDLAGRIADCLPPCDGRTAEGSHAAALTIARGLLEFAVADLDPKLFQQVLLARLQRMETDEASALDEAMLGLHVSFDSVMEQLKLVLDRLPPGPARRGEIEVYLRTLIDWLNTDPWLQDLSGSVPTPAGIERKLRVTATGRAHEQNLDADALARQCMRLVILGGPGSGKTWLAKRTARRCAEDALHGLAAGGTLDDVELPLYTTCSALFSAEGYIRDAVVSSAFDQLPDLGGSRISAALRQSFTERNTATLLIVDSLDEAHGPSDRLRQLNNFPWRVVLTSRPSSWRKQLTINDTGESHRVGKLQPLDYPGDVEPFIQRWFDGRPEGNDLAAQIAGRSDLQQAATVPLILAFYCIVGGTGPLPEFRHDLYTKVINSMLLGSWRDDDDARQQLDPDSCITVLRAWAWSGASGPANNDPVSGVGTWKDEIPTEPVRLGKADADALDHVATPLGPLDPETRKISRRFIHRSIREHLVAGHVASLPADEAVKVLLPHLWYDPDWEYTAPEAIAKHPQRDQLLQGLIRRAANPHPVPGDLSVIDIPADLSLIDAGWEFRGVLARVASESSEADWSPEVAGMIAQARMELARTGRIGDLGRAPLWGTSNRQAREALLGLLANETEGPTAAALAGRVAQLDPTAEDKRQAREALLRLLAGQTEGPTAAALAGRVAQLDPTAEDKRQAREALLRLLAGQTDSSVAAVMALVGLLGGMAPDDLVGEVVQLASTAEDKGQAREALLGLLAGQTEGPTAAALAGGLAQLASTAEDKRQAREALLGLLTGQTDRQVAVALAGRVAQLASTAEEKGQAREALLGLLTGQTDRQVAVALAGGIAQLDPTAEEKGQAREVLLGLLAVQTDGQTDGWLAAALAGGIAQLDPTAEEKGQAREVLLGLLAVQTDGQTDGWLAAALAGRVAQLDPTAEDKRQAREALLGLLANETEWSAPEDLAPEDLVGGVVQLASTAEEKGQAREALLGLLAGQTDNQSYGPTAAALADGVAQLDPTAEDKRQARGALLGLLAEYKSLAREALLGLLAGQTYGPTAAALAGRVAQLDPTAEEKGQAREALLVLLAGQQPVAVAAVALVGGVVQLASTAEEKGQARDVLLGLLANPIDSWLVEIELLAGPTSGSVAKLARWVAQLDPTAEGKRQAREALLGLLAGQTDSSVATELADGVAQLDPTADDLSTWHAWAVLPTLELLTAARRNSDLADWLGALPSLALLSGNH